MKKMTNPKTSTFIITLVAIVACGLLYYFFIYSDNNSTAINTANLGQIPTKKMEREPQIEQSEDMTNLAKIMFKSTKNNSFYIGLNGAKVSVIQFIDPENPTCAKIHEYIKNEIKYYGPNVKWTFRYLPFQPNSKLAIKILEAARKQNLYLEVLEAMYAGLEKWMATTDNPNEIKQKEKILFDIVSNVPKIKIKKIQADIKSPSIDKLINVDIEEGAALGVKSSPTLFVNYKIINPLSLDEMIHRIDSFL